MHVCLVQVPYMVGDERQGGSRGAQRLLEAGAAQALTAGGATVTVDRFSPEDRERRPASEPSSQPINSPSFKDGVLGEDSDDRSDAHTARDLDTSGAALPKARS